MTPKELFEKFWTWRLRESPEFATFCGQHEYDDRLDDVSIEGYERRGEAAKKWLEKCQTFLDDPNLSDDDRHNVALLTEDLKIFIGGLKYHGYVFPVSYAEGIQVDFELFVSWMKFNNEGDFNKYVNRLKALPKRVKQVQATLRHGMDLGITHHAQSLKGTQKQFEILQKPAEETPLFEPFRNAPESLDLTTQKKEAISLIDNEVKPAFKELSRFISEEYMNHLRPSEGVSCLPNGQDFYKECLKWHLSLNMTPAEVHDKGLEEMARIKQLMNKAIQQTGFKGDFQAFLEHLRFDEKFYHPSREAVSKAYSDLCEKVIRPKLPQLFHTMPKSKLQIELTPESRPNAPAGYYLAGTLDGTRPGKFYVNGCNLKLCPKYEMVTLSLHEGEPGHHFQSMYAIEMEGIPVFRQYLEDMNYFCVPSRFPLHTAYMEGWGLYCEYLGEELGLYEDPYDLFGHLSFEMHRACRLVVDTGIHYFGWTFEKAKSLLMENTAVSEAFIESEIRRYITWPGQACAYKIGELKIKELRASAEKQLGDKFDVRDFHEEVLRAGMVPLTVLETAIKTYISKTISQ